MRIVAFMVLLSLALAFSGCVTTNGPVAEKSLKQEVTQLRQENEMLALQRDAYKASMDRLSQETKTKLDTLQSSLLQEKQRTAALESKIAALSNELDTLKSIPTRESKSTIVTDDFTKQVQLALYTAGFNPGKIDGKMGTQTIQAIKSFQEINGLRPTGIVGKETWEKLQKYLEMK